MVSGGTLVQTLVSEQVATVVALFALQACLVALEATLVTLGADSIDLEVVARAIVPARTIKI